MLPSNSRNSEGPKPVVVMGCGRIGAAIASALANEGRAVHILDPDPAALARLPQEAVREGRIIPIVGDATLEYSLRKAQIQDADAFIAVTGQDTLNALAAQVARHIFEIPTVIARMGDPDRKELYNQLGITTISATSIVTELALQAARKSEK